ncbi:hypothetical protein HMPREF0063_11490 [Aeromicrobium marinum DSM 15272]|uniref:Uncharacterized protein n=1 Tax=Aeromicrobium marinum DSM 15272 TaxID=585531 RepID=E2SBT1_9ACTN|nr:hypothetical protein [Aeromicrobium marinum]EFQ83217.1 hypothetical protein HMPREF0063_11490 [Aeromicrobium marinum DSM 15272]
MTYTRITDGAELVSELSGSDVDDDVEVRYRVLDLWMVTIRSATSGLDTGPETLTVEPFVDEDGRAEESSRDELLTGDVLRAVPMQDARRRIKRAKLEWAQTHGYMDPIPSRFSTDRDFALLARIYADAVAAGQRNPIKNLSVRYGISRNTLSARIRVARDRGLLTRPDEGDGGSLTPAAVALLEQQAGEAGGSDG